MATTARPFEIGALGVRDSAGAVVASAKIRWYLPGTLTAATAYTDAACSTPATAPLTAGAGGQFTLYFLEAVRVIIKDSTETTTYYDDIPNLNRHDSVYVTSSGINGGAETTLEAVLSLVSTSFGSGFQYKVTSTGTARNVNAVISERMVSVKDFGAVGDGVTDDYAACQATIDYVAGLSTPGGIVFVPAGDFLCNTGLSNVTVGVSFRGVSQTLSRLVNGSTSNTLLTYNVGSAVNAKAFIRDLGLTASTTSSGTALLVSNGDRISVSGVSTALHRTGIDCNAVTAARVADSVILSTDDNASAIGIRVGARGKVTDCEAISGTDNGSGIVLNGANAKAVDCYTDNFATGISCAETNTGATTCTTNGATTGISLGGTASFADGSRATSCTTGVSVGAVASAWIDGVSYSGNTTDLSVNSSATNFYERSNWATLSAGTATSYGLPIRASHLYTTSSGGGASWAVVHTAGVYQHYRINASGFTLTLSAPSGTTKMVGDMLYLHIFSKTATLTVAFNSIYKAPDGSTALASASMASGNQDMQLDFLWNRTNYLLVRSTDAVGTFTGPLAY